jgi:O-antigen/teichoic acid export membrane protein
MFALPAIVGLSVLSKPFIRLLSTQAYSDAFLIIPFVAIAQLFEGLTLLAITGIRIAKRTSISARNYLLCGAGNIVLNLIFVPRYGYLAAAFTTVISYVALLLLNAIASAPYLRWKFPMASILKICLASAVMGVVILLISSRLTNAGSACLVCTIVGGVVYGAALVCLKELDLDRVAELGRSILKMVQSGK